MLCSLCRNNDLKPFGQNNTRPYFRCQRCHLIEVPPQFHLTAELEKQHYGSHQNHPDDPGYREFLNRLCEPLAALLPENSKGLDFGCGPGPTLCRLMQERGHGVNNFDLYFSSDRAALDQRYDFVTMTEVLEHLRAPALEVARVWQLLEEQGYLAVVTQMTDDIENFNEWYYQRDPTHICFWSKSTMRWLANSLQNAELTFPGPGLCFLRKRLA